MFFFKKKIYVCTYVCQCMHVCPEAKEGCHLVSITLSIKAGSVSLNLGLLFCAHLSHPRLKASKPQQSSCLYSSWSFHHKYVWVVRLDA